MSWHNRARMLLIRIVFIFIFLGLTTAAGATPPKRVAVLFTINDWAFLPRAKNAIRFLHTNGWKVHVFSGDPRLELGSEGALIQLHSLSKNSGFYKTVLDKVAGERIGANDQALVYVLTHGHLCSGTQEQCLDGASGTNPLKFQAPEVHAVVGQLKKTQAQVAFVNNSCHSGGSISLRNPSLCVISSTTKESSSNSGFDLFGRTLMDDSLTSLFSRALGKDKHSFSPQISSVQDVPEIRALKNLGWIHDRQTQFDELKVAVKLTGRLTASSSQEIKERVIEDWLAVKIDTNLATLQKSPFTLATTVTEELIQFRALYFASTQRAIQKMMNHWSLLNSDLMRDLTLLLLQSGDISDAVQIAGADDAQINEWAQSWKLNWLQKRQAAALVNRYRALPERQILRAEINQLREPTEVMRKRAYWRLLAAQHKLYQQIVDQNAIAAPQNPCSSFVFGQ